MKHLNELKALLAVECNCSPDDFGRENNVITLSAANEGRRIYQKEPFFFHMATLGTNAVITADERLHPFLREWAADTTGHWLFTQQSIPPLEKELAKNGYTIGCSHHLFLPQEDIRPQGDFPLKWFEGEEIHRFYGDKRFPNAICSEYIPHRPDTIVVCAMNNDEIMGMAGCSEDAKGWQQIGIDVMPKYRSKGLGKCLVATLKNEILRRGDIPFYGTSLSNLHSWNIAIGCGFRPAWTEIGCTKIERT